MLVTSRVVLSSVVILIIDAGVQAVIISDVKRKRARDFRRGDLETEGPVGINNDVLNDQITEADSQAVHDPIVANGARKIQDAIYFFKADRNGWRLVISTTATRTLTGSAAR